MIMSSIFDSSRFAIVLDLGGVCKMIIGPVIMYGNSVESRVLGMVSQ